MRCTRVQGQCHYEPTQRQLKKQEKARAAPPPRVSKKRAPVPGTRSTRRLRDILPRPEEPAPVNEGSAPGLEGMPQYSRLEELAAAEELLLDLYLNTFEMPVAGAEGGEPYQNYGLNLGGPVAGAEGGELYQNYGLNFGGPAAGADGGSQYLGGLDREFGALDVGSHGVQQYPQQAGPVFGGYTPQAIVPLPYYDERGLPFQGSAGPSNWTSPNLRPPSTVTHWPDGTLPMDPGMDNVPQVETAVPVRPSQQDRWENAAEADRAARASSAEQDAMDLSRS